MTNELTEYKLAAILSGDIAGYSRLIGRDEAAAVRLVTAYREEIERVVPAHNGTLVDFTGDNFLAHFSSSRAAVQCAVEIQGILRVRNQDVPETQKMQFRLGIHQGDVRMEGGRVFGTGVNIAARLESLADPGGICISGSVKDQLQGRLNLPTESMGERTVKNIDQPVQVYRLLLEGAADAVPAIPVGIEPRRSRVGVMIGVSVVVALLVGAFWVFFVADEAADSPLDPGDPVAIHAPKSATGVGATESGEGPALHEGPSIVVLPFINLSDEPEQAFFADGISEDLTTDLSKVPGLLVISRSSAFTYKGKRVDAKEVGRELGVRYMLEGSVRKVGGRVRITAQLINTKTGFHVWSDRYDRELSDIFEIQNEIDEKILSALQISIAEAEMERIRRRPIENLSAYEAWHKGRTLVRNLTKEDILEGRRLLERAVELQPDWGDAYSELSNSYLAEFQTWNIDPSLLTKANELAEKGLDLSPSSPVGLFNLAIVKLMTFAPEEAILLSTRGVELAPSDFTGYSILGGAYLVLGQTDKAIENLERAVQLNPVAPDIAYSFLASALYFSDRQEEGVKLWERVRAANSEALIDRLSLVMHYQNSGDHTRAESIVKEVLQTHPEFTAEDALQMFEMGAVSLSEEQLEEIERNFQLSGLP